MPTIIYTLISSAYSPTPLGEVSLASGNFHLMALKLLEKCKNENNTSKSYAYEQEYMFHYHNKSGLSVLCMTSSNFSNKLAYSFLFEIRDKVLEAYGSEIEKAIGFSLKKHFIEEIKQTMKKYNKTTSDQLDVVKKNIDDVKSVLVQNIDKILERSEKIELLVNKTEELSNSGIFFSRSSVKVKRHFLCKNLKLTIVVSLILMAIVMLIVVLSCGGFELKKCRG